MFSVLVVVENDPIALGLYKIILQKEGFGVFEANHSDTVLSLIGSVKSDLILIDLRLPQLEGFELCKRLKAAPDTRHIPIVFISGAAEDAIIQQAYALGAADFIVKPCRMHQLIAHVRKHLNSDEGRARQ